MSLRSTLRSVLLGQCAFDDGKLTFSSFNPYPVKECAFSWARDAASQTKEDEAAMNVVKFLQLRLSERSVLAIVALYFYVNGSDINSIWSNSEHVQLNWVPGTYECTPVISRDFGASIFAGTPINKLIDDEFFGLFSSYGYDAGCDIIRNLCGPFNHISELTIQEHKFTMLFIKVLHELKRGDISAALYRLKQTEKFLIESRDLSNNVKIPSAFVFLRLAENDYVGAMNIILHHGKFIGGTGDESFGMPALVINHMKNARYIDEKLFNNYLEVSSHNFDYSKVPMFVRITLVAEFGKCLEFCSP